MGVMELPPGFNSEGELDKALQHMLAYREKVRQRDTVLKKTQVKVYVRWPGASWILQDVFSDSEEAKSYLEDLVLPYNSLLRVVGPGGDRYFFVSIGCIQAIPKKFLQEYIREADNREYLSQVFKGTGLLYGFAGSPMTGDRIERLRSGLPVGWIFTDGVGEIEMTLSQARTWAEAGGMDVPSPYGPVDVSGRISEEEMGRVESLSHLEDLVQDKSCEVYNEDMEGYKEKSLKLLEDIKREVD